MNKVSPKQQYVDQNKLTCEAIRESIAARKFVGQNLISPINIYDLAEAHDVKVRFTAINMEGMYDRSPRPRIHISAQRPLVRRNLTCAHELGHHVFGHGSTIDEISKSAEIPDYCNPDEFIANQFAYNLMMPVLGVRNAFSMRAIEPARANSVELFRISSHFSVGYLTLLTHLRYGLKILPHSQFQHLAKYSPKNIRSELLEIETTSPMVIVDQSWGANTVDVETGTYISLFAKLDECPDIIEFVGQNQHGHIYRAIKQGVRRLCIQNQTFAVFLRVSKRQVIDGLECGYVGLAQYRHLEDDAE